MARKKGERKCSRCKKYSANAERWHGGVFCPDCLKSIRDARVPPSLRKPPTIKVSGPAKLDLRDE